MIGSVLRTKLAAFALVAVLASSQGSCDPPEEDEPGWDCKKHGNRRCGPGIESTR